MITWDLIPSIHLLSMNPAIACHHNTHSISTIAIHLYDP